jgi:two-component system, chemotaxis family, sensor kinase CheA
MAIDLKRFHSTFIGESYLGLDSMEADLLEIDRGSREPELLQSIFRAVHSIKGAGSTLGFEQLSEFSHDLESLLDDLRSSRLEINSSITDILLRSVDLLRRMLGAIQGGAEVAAPDVENARERTRSPPRPRPRVERRSR